MNDPRSILAICGLFLAILGLAGPAEAQYALGDGAGLDNNLDQRGTGRNPGSNRPSFGRVQNLQVTGNVRGLSNFRDSVGYTASREFRDELGSNQLFNFFRRSTGAGSVAGQSRPGYAVPSYEFGGAGGGGAVGIYDNDSRVVYRAGSHTSIGQVSRGGLAYGQGLGGRASTFDAASINRTYGVGGRTESLTEQAIRAYGSTNLGGGSDRLGRNVSITASPLTGVAVRRTLPQVYQMPDYASQFDGAGASEDLAGRRVDPSELADAPDQRLSTLSEARRMDFARQLEVRLQADGAFRVDGDTQPGDLNRSLQRLLESDEAAPRDDAYGDLLQRLRERHTPTARHDAPAPEAGAEADDPSAAAGSPAERYRVPGEPTDDASATDRVLRRLDYDYEPIASFRGSADTLFNEVMQRGERYMRDGRFFDAVSAYDRALSIRQDYPLAVAGKTHALMGAGLFASADQMLRSLFHRHPELISARYTQPVLPADDRLQTIRRQLNSLAERDADNRAAPLLLAYLHYQQRHPAELAQALQTLAERESDPTLVRLLRRLWMDTDADPTPAGP